MTTRHALAAATAAALTASFAPAVGAAEAPADILRLAGTDRFGTAAAISLSAFPEPVDEVFVVTGSTWPDALAAGAAAATADAPVLPVHTGEIPDPIAAELERLQPVRAVVVGGASAVSDAVVAELERRGLAVERIAGENRYETAASVAERFFGEPGGAYYASGERYADALGGGAAAAQRGWPLLLTSAGSLPAATPVVDGERIVLGGQAAVSETVRTRLSARRVAGADRYATAAAIARDAFASTSTAYLATGLSFPDALAGTPAAARDGAPILLAADDCVAQPTRDAVTALGVTRIVALGGGRAVSDRAAALEVCLPTAVTPPATDTDPGEEPQRTLTFSVRTKGTVHGDVGTFARIVGRTFNDRRGWSLGGSIRYRQVASGGDLVVWLASPAAVESFSPSICDAGFSCRIGNNVIINDDRWRLGTKTWTDVREYRPYVLNHELGHWFGIGHQSCSGTGAFAAVMQQQSVRLSGCRTNTWPLELERRAAASAMRVSLRPEAPTLLTLKRRGNEVHALSGASGYRSWLANATATLPRSEGERWSFSVADHDGDGVGDLYAIRHVSGSTVAVHVRSGASGWRTVLLDTLTALRVADGGSWSFAVVDHDGDGHHDLLAVNGQGVAGTEVHVLSGASGYRTWLLHAATPLHRTSLRDWSFVAGDHDRNGVPDLYAISRSGTDVHVLSGMSGFRTWLAHAVTPLGPTPPDDWSYAVADLDGNGFDELFAIQRMGSSGRTEVHVLDRSFTRWMLHAVTVLGPTVGEERWAFDVF